jgi:farnesyl-diphosphate farnesyltransferase
MPLWSPWFRIITERLLVPWWKDLDAALATDKYVDTSSIHRFDPPPVHVGGAGNARPNLDALFAAETAAKMGSGHLRDLALNAERAEKVSGIICKPGMQAMHEDSKQGAYGKVPTHSSSKLAQLLYPMEIIAALRIKVFNSLENNLDTGRDDIAFCDRLLGKVSRSFAAVIRQLPPGLCLDMAIFYLVLRALDTIEDDMEAYSGRETQKQDELKCFAKHRLCDCACSIDGVGAGDERVLLQQFGVVARVFQSLSPASQAVIQDITRRMGEGMADYVSADLAQGTADQAAYDLYCYHVAGLVGEGLTRMFIASGFEQESLKLPCVHWSLCPDMAKQPANYGLSTSMGLFLQKTNIIRDYLEDYVDGRAFWPQSVWRRHAITGDLGEFARPTAHGAGVRLPMSGAAGRIVAKGVGTQALCCLNELVADALELVPDCLMYLRRIQTPAIYRFAAIPQVMAIATLAECFDNPLVFTGVVKIRKGQAARLMQACMDGPDAVNWWFAKFARSIQSAVQDGSCSGASGPIGERVGNACARILELTEPERPLFMSCPLRKRPGQNDSARALKAARS